MKYLIVIYVVQLFVLLLSIAVIATLIGIFEYESPWKYSLIIHSVCVVIGLVYGKIKKIY